MSSPALEGFLARLYTDEPTLSEFLRRPTEIARAAGLSDAEVMALEGADHVGLVMAASSFRAKRQQRRNLRPLSWLFSVWNR
jgi:pantoate kinase